MRQGAVVRQGGGALCSWIRASCQGSRARACSALTAAFVLLLAAHAQARSIPAHPVHPTSAAAVSGMPSGAAAGHAARLRTAGPPRLALPRTRMPRSRVRPLTVSGFGLPAPRAPGL